MNIGPKNPSGPGGGKGRRRRGRRGAPGHGGRPGGGSRGANTQGIFTRPMDHSYRNSAQSQQPGQAVRMRNRGGLGTRYVHPEPEPVPNHHDNAQPRIFAFVDDLFFLAKIQEVARKLNVKVEFVKSDKEIGDKINENGQQPPSLIIIDLNNAAIKPLAVIPKLKREFKRTAIIGFVSHVQGELKVKAQEAGCDMVLPRSAFSQNLPSLLRRHGAPAEE